MNNLKSYNLQGPVKSLWVVTYKEEGIGSLLNASQKSLSGLKHSEIAVYSFNPCGNLSEYSIYKADGKLREQNHFTYTKSGKLLEHLNYVPNGISMRDVFNYDKNDYCYSKEMYLHGFILVYIDHAVNDGKGVCKAIEEYDIEANLTRITKYEEDQHGNTTGLSVYGADGKLLEGAEYILDESGNKIEEKRFVGSNQYRWLNKYDKANYLTECLIYTNDGLDSHYLHTYDFDANGNWIKRTIKKNGLLHEIQTREMEYFN